MKAYEIVGYTDRDGDHICPVCARSRNTGIDSELAPIFAGTEFDYQPYCYECDDPIEDVTGPWAANDDDH